MKRDNISFIILGILSFLNFLAWIGVFDLSQPRFLEVNFFDVGQGDAIFIETPQSHQILIDGGPDSTILRRLAEEMPFWDRTLDLVVLTHPERDHLAGILAVLKSYKIENIFWTGVVRETSEYQEWENLIKKERAKIFIAQAGQRIKMGKTNFAILFPFEKLEGKEMEDSNNSSIVMRLVFGKNSFLFTGDIYQSGEKEIIERKIFLDSDVLKVSHHGSKTSSSEDFLKGVSPEFAIISLSKDNKYGHPHSEVLERLEKFAIKTLRTDKDGNIKIISDGLNFKIKNKK